MTTNLCGKRGSEPYRSFLRTLSLPRCVELAKNLGGLPLTHLLPQLARGLRTRLTYASYKAAHHLEQTSISDLEAQTQLQGHSQSAKLPIGKATALAPNSHYSNPAAHGVSPLAPNASTKSLVRKGTMPPPSGVTASATQSLFSSLLQPPPSKRARTIHNPEDPPIPPPPKARPVTPPRKTTKSTRVPPASNSSKAKARKDVKGKKRETAPHAPTTSSRIITPQSTLGSEGFVDNDDDMKAAATLTSLLHASRPSVSVTASSPRSSMSGGSDAGSNQSYSHYAQSSTRTTAPTSLAPTAGASFNPRFTRSSTPPSSSSRHARTQSLPHVGSTTPKALPRMPSAATVGGGSSRRLANTGTPHPPSDTEAADLMLFLATSPSPVRPTASKDRDPKDVTAFRSLSGISTLKGRILFPGVDDHTNTLLTTRYHRIGEGYAGTSILPKMGCKCTRMFCEDREDGADSIAGKVLWNTPRVEGEGAW